MPLLSHLIPYWSFPNCPLLSPTDLLPVNCCLDCWLPLLALPCPFSFLSSPQTNAVELGAVWLCVLSPRFQAMYLQWLLLHVNSPIQQVHWIEQDWFEKTAFLILPPLSVQWGFIYNLSNGLGPQCWFMWSSSDKCAFNQGYKYIYFKFFGVVFFPISIDDNFVNVVIEQTSPLKPMEWDTHWHGWVLDQAPSDIFLMRSKINMIHTNKDFLNAKLQQKKIQVSNQLQRAYLALGVKLTS